MRGIGIRCAANSVHYAVVEGEPGDFRIVTIDRFKYPKQQALASQVARASASVRDAAMQLDVDAVALKLAEPSALRHGGPKAGTIRRLYAEGAMLVSVAELGVPFFAGVNNEYSSWLGSNSIKDYLDEPDFRGLKGFSEITPKEAREATWVAVASLILLSSGQS